MKVLRLVTNIDDLHLKSEDVSGLSDSRLHKAAEALISEYKSLAGKALGLSAPQVGMRVNVILIRKSSPKEPVIYYNTKVLKEIGHKDSNEGCISEGNIRYIVKRPMLAKVEYFTMDGVHHVEWMGFKRARVFCHENDHIHGILLQDKGVLA